MKQGDKHPRRYWECECCSSLLVTLKQDDATRYQCPQCQISKCSAGLYIEISIDKFCKEANIVSDKKDYTMINNLPVKNSFLSEKEKNETIPILLSKGKIMVSKSTYDHYGEELLKKLHGENCEIIIKGDEDENKKG